MPQIIIFDFIFQVGLYHVIYVDENPKLPENPENPEKLPENLSKCLSQLSNIGIEEGIISKNKDFMQMLDGIMNKMFPLQNLTEVNNSFYFSPKSTFNFSS